MIFLLLIIKTFFFQEIIPVITIFPLEEQCKKAFKIVRRNSSYNSFFDASFKLGIINFNSINHLSSYTLLNSNKQFGWHFYRNRIVFNVNSLRNIIGMVNDRVSLLGYYNQGDGGGQDLYWDALSTEADNSGTVFQVEGIPVGRWKSINKSTINVKWFGARGDGINNDTNPIQNCFNSISNGVKILFRGQYNILDTLSLRNKSDIVLDLKGCYIYQKTIRKPPLVINNCNSIIIENGNFVGLGGNSGEWEHGSNLTSWNNVAAIYLKNSYKVTIRNNTIKDFAGAGIYWLESDLLNITGNNISGIGANHINGVDNNRGFAIGGASDNFDRMDFSFNIIGNEISGHSFGIFANRANNLLIKDNYIHDIPGQHGIYLIECSGVNISYNNFRNIRIQAIKTQNENYVGRSWAPIGTPNTNSYNVIKNTIDNAAQGIAFLTAPLYMPHNQLFENIRISNNIIRNVTEAGIVLQRVTSSIINENYIINSQKYGIRIESHGGKISKNRIKNTYSSGIFGYLYTNTEFSSNYLEDCGYNNLTGGAGADNPIYIYSGKDLPSNVKSSIIVTSTNDKIYSTRGNINALSVATFLDKKLIIDVNGMRTNIKKPFQTSSKLINTSHNQFKGILSPKD